ncbi:MAG: HAMP domain-containing protein [Candidatus Brocadiae bacterium]|nr:HAMP domain-containing protein [Candidatus Brocadiia bacterium]
MSSRTHRRAFFRRARFKLTLLYTSIQFVILIIMCAFLYYRNSRSMDKQLERFLKDEARDVIAMVHDHPDDWAAIRDSFRRESGGERYYTVSFRLLDLDGKILAASRTLRDERVAPVTPEALEIVRKADTYQAEVLVPDATAPERPSRHLLMAVGVQDREGKSVLYVLQVLADLRPLRALSRHLRHNIYSAVPVLLLLSWIVGYMLARRFLRPIHTITRTARRITSTNLNERLLRTNSGDELDMLAATLNDMIGRLEESFALLRQFAADAAHELRTPLTILKGEAELALRGDVKDAVALREALEGSVRECDHMIGVVANLLALCRADMGDEALAHEPVRLDLLLTDLAETFLILAEDGGIALQYTEFPEIVVLGERSRLHELIANVLDNAVKYTPKGGRVSLACEVDAEEVRVIIADTGIGIPEDDQTSIFDRFYRVDTSRSRDTGGSGLGLSIARAVATAYSGEIEVESAPGAGSRFTITLPLAPPGEAAGGELTDE